MIGTGDAVCPLGLQRFHPRRSGFGDDGLRGFDVTCMGECLCCIFWSILFNNCKNCCAARRVRSASESEGTLQFVG